MSKREDMNAPQTLYLCMGSVCHQMGVRQVLPRVQALLAAHDLAEHVELNGSFCLGTCGQGIVMRFGDTDFRGIRPHNIDEKFEREILPVIQAARQVKREKI